MLTTGEKLTLSISRQQTRSKALFALGIVSFFWGTTWLASRQGVQHMPPLQMAAIRQLVAGIAFLAFFLSRGEPMPTAKEWGTILQLGFFNIFLSNGLTTWGVKYISAGLGAIIAAIFPLWLVIFGLFGSSKSKIEPRALVGLVLGFAGVCVIFYEHLQELFDADFRFGILISLIATLSWAVGAVYTKREVNQFNPYFSIGLQMLLSGIMLYAVSAATGAVIPIARIPWQSWAAVAYLSIFGSIISFLAYLYALKHLPTEQVSIYAYINPVVAVILGALVFGEKLTIFIGLGGAITLYGVYLVNESFRKSKQ